MNSIVVLVLLYVGSVIVSFLGNYAAVKLSPGSVGVWSPGWVIPAVNTLVAIGMVIIAILLLLVKVWDFCVSLFCRTLHADEDDLLSSSYWESRWTRKSAYL